MDASMQKSREEFEYWLASMDDFLEMFMSEFPEEEQCLLDYSPESLEVVEKWILSNYEDTRAALKISEIQRVNNAACYVGEVFRKSHGGKWSIRLDDPKFAFYALPVLTDGKKTECPLSLVTASTNRRTGTYLRMVLENY
ncbi:vWA domain-containing protein [Gimesia algae]|nr:hypothetical protein [Gimesia algae]